jgi:hypothetical protein
MIHSRLYPPLPGRGQVDPSRGTKTTAEQARREVDPAQPTDPPAPPNPGIAASAELATSHGSTSTTTTVVLVIAVLLFLGIAANVQRTGRHTRPARRRTRAPQRATVIGGLALGVVLGATVAGGQIAHAVLAALVAIGHALAGMLP